MIPSIVVDPDTLGVRLLACQWAEEHALDASHRGIRSGSPGSQDHAGKRNGIARMKTLRAEM